MKIKPITDEEVRTALETYARIGKVRWRGQIFQRTDQPTNDPSADPYYYEIYDRNAEMVTDGDDLAAQLRGDQEWIDELIAKRRDVAWQVVSGRGGKAHIYYFVLAPR